jgi:hypothetical protein
MAFLDTPNTIMYYDIFEPNFTATPLSSQINTVLLIHGFGGTPESDFGAQLPIISERIPNAQLLLFDAGHAAHIRCEKEYTSTIMEFFLDQKGRKDSQ